MTFTRRLFAAAALTLLLVTAVSAESLRVTFLQVNDIYLMGDQVMPDGKRRGGFARLAAVVKAERAKARTTGGHVILAHGGDTLSPSLMSGIDKGAHMIALTNMVLPDIFAPGNHEFDFGKSIFLQRMAEARFPLYAANLRGGDGAPLPSFKDRAIVTLDGVRIGLTGATYDDSPRASSPQDLRFAPTVATISGKLYAADAAISRRDVLAELPFGNRVVTLDISGHALKAAIENGLSQLPNASGRFPQVSGLVVEADLKRPPGSRITAIKVGNAPLDEARSYRVATNDFLARGGDGYAMLADTAPTLADSDAPPVAGEVIEYIKSIGTLRTGVEGRIVVR
jgi:2',3'-cyclic-nucleotide 2'-phosphodiesterase (5'-nucleotidase family)